jgi:nitroreductase
MQQMDLFFSANDIGSCWQALPQPNKEILESSELEFIILMPFGKPAESLHRANVSEFKRKSLKKITDIIGADYLLEAARLAPSGGSEPWYFTGNENPCLFN